jgi:hypothetical protein
MLKIARIISETLKVCSLKFSPLFVIVFLDEATVTVAIVAGLVQSLLSSGLRSANLKIRIYKTIILPVVLSVWA